MGIYYPSKIITTVLQFLLLKHLVFYSKHQPVKKNMSQVWKTRVWLTGEKGGDYQLFFFMCQNEIKHKCRQKVIKQGLCCLVINLALLCLSRVVNNETIRTLVWITQKAGMFLCSYIQILEPTIHKFRQGPQVIYSLSYRALTWSFKSSWQNRSWCWNKWRNRLNVLKITKAVPMTKVPLVCYFHKVWKKCNKG